jgi:hypothetical protein
MATPYFRVEVVLAFRIIHSPVRHPQYVDEAVQVLNTWVALDHADEIVVA